MISAPIRIRRGRVAVLLLVLAAVVLALGDGMLASPSTTTASPAKPPRDKHHPRHASNGALGLAGGAIPDGTTIFDGDVPGVARLDPALRSAVRRAATDSGVTFVVDSGWRSRAYQAQLLRDAVAQYGSAEEAARWVATPQTSAHVSGDAIDLGRDAAAWLSDHGAPYGLCQIYDNETWHFELRPEAVQTGCPPRYADPTHDPRMSR